MQLEERERIDALLDESRDLVRARLTNLAVNGDARMNLSTAAREYEAKLRRAPHRTADGRADANADADLLDSFAQKRWRTYAFVGGRWVATEPAEVS